MQMNATTPDGANVVNSTSVISPSAVSNPEIMQAILAVEPRVDDVQAQLGLNAFERSLRETRETFIEGLAGRLDQLVEEVRRPGEQMQPQKLA